MAALAAVACARRAPAPPPPPPEPKIVEQPLPPTTTPDFVIGPIRQTPSADGRTVFVEGSVRNRGSRPSRDVTVWVEGRDAQGGVVAKAETLPVPQLIPPGGQATWTVSLPDDPAIRDFHVEAIGR